MSKKLFTIIVSVQVIIIAYLVKSIYFQKTKILGTSTNPIKQEDITKNPADNPNLKNFYEPKAGEIITEQQEWLKTQPVYIINDDSLNERFNYPVEKSPDTFRIIALGDSFTFGEYVNTKGNYPEKLEDYLNNTCPKDSKYEVINLGVVGYDVQYTTERYFKRGQKYSPDLVIWLINDWNFFRINEQLFDRVKEIQNKANADGTADQRIKDEGRYYAWTQAQDELVTEMGKDSISSKQLEYFNDFRDSYNGNLILMIFPDQIRNNEIDGWFSDFIDKISKINKNTYVFDEIEF